MARWVAAPGVVLASPRGLGLGWCKSLGDSTSCRFGIGASGGDGFAAGGGDSGHTIALVTGGATAFSAARTQARRIIPLEHGLVTGLHLVGFRCAHPFHALVADPALGFDIATLDLGLADLSGDGF